MANLVERLGWTLVHFVWEGAAAALLLALALWLTKRDSARTRYAVACFAMAVLAIAPAVTFWLLTLDAATVLPSVAHAKGRTWTDAQVLMVGGTALGDLLPWLVRFWLIGVLLLSLRLGGTLLHLERWRRHHTRPADEAWQTRLDNLTRSLGIHRSVRLLVSDRINVPSAWGVLKTVVVLPTSLMTYLPPEQVETILLHELAHIRRHDYLVNLLQAVVETVLFYHPAVWWVSAVVRREREHCCDDVVVAHRDPMPYARALLHLEERRLILPRPTLSAKESNLMNRIARILTPKPTPPRVSPLASSMAALGIVAAILGGTIEAQAQAKPAPKPKPAPKIARRLRVHIKHEPARAAKPAAKPKPKAAPKVIPVVPAKATGFLVKPGTMIDLRVNPTMVATEGFATTIRSSVATGVASTILSPAKVSTVTATTRKVPVLGDLPIVGSLFTTQSAQTNAQSVVTSRPAVRSGAATAQGFGGHSVAPRGLSGGFGGGGQATTAAAQGGFFGGGSNGFKATQGGFKGGGGQTTVAVPNGFGIATLGGVTRATRDDYNVNVSFDRDKNTVSVDLTDVPLAEAIKGIARKAKFSVVFESGNYGDVTMVLNDIPFETALRILCRVAGATYRHEENVYFIAPKGS